MTERYEKYMRVANRKCIRRLSMAHMKSAKNRNMVTILDKHPSGAFYVMQYDFF
jgi:hypothetical protein